MEVSNGGRSVEIPVEVQLRLIVAAIVTLNDRRGSTLKDIRKALCSVGVITKETCLRRAMIVGLKAGVLARPEWACKVGVYGRYVLGDGVPVFVDKNNRLKHPRHRIPKFVSGGPSGICKRKQRQPSQKK